MSTPKSVVFPYSLNRRAFLAQAMAAGASTVLWSCGGGGGSSSPEPSPTPTPTPTPTQLSIASITPNNPTALTPITVQVTGLDTTKPFTVTIGGQAQTPMHATGSTIVLTTPLNVDATAGATAPLSTTLSVTQNGGTASSPLQTTDLPQLSDLGVPLGTISRAFLNYQAIVLGQSINAQQAISLLPQAGNPNNATLIAHSQTQLLNVIRARNDIDRIVSNNATVIPIGITPTAGLPLQFDQNSVAMMDRIFAQYLLAGTSNGTVLPQVRVRKSGKRKRAPLLTVSGGTFYQTIAQLINTESGAASYLGYQQTQASSDSSYLDNVIAKIGMYSSFITLGANLVGLGALALGAAPVITFAGGVAAVATLAGIACGTFAMGNDYYNLVSNIYAYESNQPGASASKIGSAFASLAADGLNTFIAAEGMGGLQTGVSNAVGTVWEDIFKASEASTTQGAAQLMVSTDNLLIQQTLEDDSNSANNNIQNVSPTDFGLVEGMCTVSNSQGPILSGLSGVGVGDANGSLPDTLTSIAAPDGSYELVLPIGSPDLTYNAMDVAAFDPVDLYDPTINTLTILGSSSVVDLSGVNPNTPIAGPSFVGTCIDTDAGSPDGDDPDCD